LLKKNPFTGDVLNVEDWDPGPPADSPPGLTLFAAHGRLAIGPILSPDDEYQTWLEESSPILLRTLPHSAMKGISKFELSALSELLLGRREPPAVFIDCLDGEGFIGAVPTAAIEPLANLTDGQLRQIAAQWQEALRNGGESEALEWTMRRVRALAAEAQRSVAHLLSHVLI
jgi:hypothetical protein